MNADKELADATATIMEALDFRRVSDVSGALGLDFALPKHPADPIDAGRQLVLNLHACERCHALGDSLASAPAGAEGSGGEKCNLSLAEITFDDHSATLGSWSPTPITPSLAHVSLRSIHGTRPEGALGMALSDAWEAAQRVHDVHSPPPMPEIALISPTTPAAPGETHTVARPPVPVPVPVPIPGRRWSDSLDMFSSDEEDASIYALELDDVGAEPDTVDELLGPREHGSAVAFNRRVSAV